MTTTTGRADHYAVLGVPRDAPTEAVRAAYRERMRTAHPDAGGSVELAQALNEAHRVLTDPAHRARYDAVLLGAAEQASRAAPAWGTARPVRFPAAGRPGEPAPPADETAPVEDPPIEDPPVEDPPDEPERRRTGPEADGPGSPPEPGTRTAAAPPRVLVLPQPVAFVAPAFRLPRWAALGLGCAVASAGLAGGIGIANGAAVAGWVTLGLLAASVATGWWSVAAPSRLAHLIGLATWLGCTVAMTAVADRTTGIPAPMILLAFLVAAVLSPLRAERRRHLTEAARANDAAVRLRRAALEWDALLVAAAARRAVPRWVERAVSDEEGAETRVRLRSARGRAAAHVLRGLWPSGIWVVTDRTGTVHGWATEEARRTWERFAQEAPA